MPWDMGCAQKQKWAPGHYDNYNYDYDIDDMHIHCLE
jgi:hypothetical protein